MSGAQRLAGAVAELAKRERRKRHKASLQAFVRDYWHIIEPGRPFREGWTLSAICEHLEAVTQGKITRLLINVSPGSMKSLLVNVFWPAWEWGPCHLEHLRYVSFSYASHLTERDNRRLLALLQSPEYSTDYPHASDLVKVGETLISNKKSGWKLAASVEGVGTGERGDRILCLPAHETILTDRGWLPIGSVVSDRMDVRIAGWDGNRVVWQDIEAYERNPGRELVEVAGDGFRLQCTADHLVYVEGRGYVQAQHICAGDRVSKIVSAIDMPMVRDDRASQAVGPAEVLQSSVQACAPLTHEASGRHKAVRCLRGADLSTARALGEEHGRHLLQPQVSWGGKRRDEQPSLSRRPRALHVPTLRKGIRARPKARAAHDLLLTVVCGQTSLGDGARSQPAHRHDCMRYMRQSVSQAARQKALLLASVRGACAFGANQRARQRQVHARASGAPLPGGLDATLQSGDSRPRRPLLRRMRGEPNRRRADIPRASHRLCERKPRSIQPNHSLPVLPRVDARRESAAGHVALATVSAVERIGFVAETFNVSVAPCHNYFAGGILVHNCDDPHNVRDGESEAVRTRTVTWFREAMSNRLNDIETGVIVVIMQRVHEADVSGTILSEELGYDHLMIPMEYDPSRHCTTSIGWTDPRTVEGELAWPERFSQKAIDKLRRDVGAYGYASQYQQTPVPRGGGIFRDEWWQRFDLLGPNGRAFPPMEFTVASLDPAYTDKQANDFSALTVWGMFRLPTGAPALMLLYGWQKRLILHSPETPRKPGESKREYEERCKPTWGLVEWVGHTCERYKVDKLLIEAKASGHSVAQEIRRLYAGNSWGCELVNPKALDKVARAHAVTHLLTDGIVYVPRVRGNPEALRWVQDYLLHMGAFPRGRHDDWADSTTQALNWLRQSGILIRREEQRAAEAEEREYRKPDAPLYPV